MRFDTVVGQAPECAGSPAWLDAVLARQAAFFNLSVPDTVVYHYRPYPTPLPCPPGAAGCTDPSLDIYARSPDMVHELVHAIFDANMGGAPVSFFNEGAAVALGGPDQDGEPAPNYDQPLDPLIGGVLPSSDYALAGDFASYLLSTRGPAPYVDLLRHAAWGSDAPTVRAAFLAAYGASIDDLVTERRGSGRSFVGYRLAFPECSGALVSWSGTSWQNTTAVDCTSSGIGPLYNYDPPATDTFTALDIPAAGYYHATISSNGGFAWMNRCSDGAQLAFLSFGNPPGLGQREVLAALSTGTHFLRFVGDIGAPASFAVGIEPTINASAGCSGPPPLDIADDTNGVEFLGGDSPIVASIRVALTRTWTVEAWDGSALWQCTDPCTTSTCTQLVWGAALSLSAATVYTFRAQGPHAGFYR